MDLSKLTPGDTVVAVSGILLFIFGLLPWYGGDGEFLVGNNSAWSYFLFGIIPIVIGLVMVAQVLISAYGSSAEPKVGSLTWGQVHLILGGVAFALIVIKIVAGSDAETDFGQIVALERRYGIFLAALAAAGLVVGAYLKTQEDSRNVIRDGEKTPPAA